MANELVARKGLKALAASSVTGGLTVDTLTAASLAYPSADGTSGQAIVTNGSGTLSFASFLASGDNVSDLTNDAGYLVSGDNISVLTNNSGYITDITAETLGSLSDVTITSAADTDVLQYNGSAWVNVDVETVGVTTLAGLTDTSVSGASDGDFLIYSSNAWVRASVAVGDLSDGGDYSTTAEADALYVPLSQKGAANGVATLDGSGLVPSSQLPSYVDDVLEYANESSFPASGEAGKLYVDLSDNSVHRWSGSAYVNITDYSTPGHTHVAADITDFDAEVDNQIAAANIGDLANVTISSIATNEILQWNGSAFINQTFAEANIAAADHTHTHDDITDFDTESAAIADTQIAAASIADLSDVGALGSSGQVYVSSGSALVATTLDHDNISDFDSAVTALIGDNPEALGDLTDVTITSVANGEFLKYTGSNWANVDIAISDVTSLQTTLNDKLEDITAESIGDLSDVTITGHANGDVLTSDGTDFHFVTPVVAQISAVAIGSDGATLVTTATHSSNRCAYHVDYAITNSSGAMRTGTLMVVTNNSAVELTDMSTNSIGTEADIPEFSANNNGSALEIKITDGSGYTFQGLQRNVFAN